MKPVESTLYLQNGMMHGKESSCELTGTKCLHEMTTKPAAPSANSAPQAGKHACSQRHFQSSVISEPPLAQFGFNSSPLVK